MGRARLVLLLGGLLAAPLATCAEEPAPKTLCNAGDLIFCRCRGGTGGQKLCQPDGMSFGPCEDPIEGPCIEAHGSSGTSSSSSSGAGGEGGSGSGKKLLDPCGGNEECASNVCRMGYCTKDCAKWQECTDEAKDIYGDCVLLNGAVQQCVPYCFAQADCQPYGPASGCGFAQAVDAYGVTVCADWQGGPQLPPDGYECFDDFECHLGFNGEQRVCEFGQCMPGCHVKEDCPEGATCVTTSKPGKCEVK
ncbi:MAG: hypothetical protein HY744_13955 [Deltaproteobacteria bacterium]|nr:hypothetical protein [Deltaproteobacteria bacterium]